MLLAKLISAAAVLSKAGRLTLFADAADGLFKIKNGDTNTVKILGNGIKSIALQGTFGLTKTYRITRDDDSIFDFAVTDGRSIVSITAPETPGMAGALDTYTISYNNETTSTFVVRNGTNGLDGQGQPATATPVAVADSGAVGTQTTKYSLEDHRHAHGSQTNPVHHAVATTSDNGFMSSTDKSKLDGIEAQATRVLVDAAPTDGSANAVSSNSVFDALALKLNAAEKGAANGVATLGPDQKIPAIQLPAFVDDVLEFANLAAFPATGETGKIYVAQNAGTPADPSKSYRWSGSTYIEISPSPGSTDVVPEGVSNKYFTESRVLATVLTGLSLAAGTAITAADSVLSALGKLQKQITDALASLAAHVAATDPHPKLAMKQLTDQAYSTTVANFTLSVPTAEIVAGSEFEFDFFGSQINTTAASNTVLTVLYNGVTLATATLANGTTAAASPGTGYGFRGVVVFRAAGAGGLAFAVGTILGFRGTAAGANSNAVAPVTVNTTATADLVVRISSSVATTTGTIRGGFIAKKL